MNIGMVPVDMDVTPMDNSKTQKEGIGWTYKKFDGYAPMMAYILDSRKNMTSIV